MMASFMLVTWFQTIGIWRWGAVSDKTRCECMEEGNESHDSRKLQKNFERQSPDIVCNAGMQEWF